jgi:hypothetical protein
MTTPENNTGQGRKSSVSSESQAAPASPTQAQGRNSSASAETQTPPANAKPEAQGRETPSSANPDHSGGKVESGQVKDGAVAATEEEKGGSSD